MVLNVPEFWIYQGSEYASGFEYARILNASEFWICQGYTGLRICLNNSWLYLNMPHYVGICLSMPEYAWVCLNLHERLLLYISPVVTLHYMWFLIEGPQETRGLSLKESEAVFLKWQNFTLSIATGSIIHLFFILD